MELVVRDTATTTIRALFTTPEALLTPPAIIDCLQDAVQIDGSMSTAGDTIQYSWLTP
ncbi:MAG: hypothetical protein R2795_04175 [Saprospiraceae bacterium]